MLDKSLTSCMLRVPCRGSIKLVNLVDNTQVTVFKGHQGAVRSLAFDPRGDYFASTGADGTVRIWSLSDCTEVKCLSVIPKGEPERCVSDKQSVSFCV
jgi:WD40 repeat protein